jgi:hypothetical protein
MTTPIATVLTEAEHRLTTHLTSLVGDLEAFVRQRQSWRWQSTGYEHPCVKTAGDGHLLFGFYGRGDHPTDTSDPTFVAAVDAGRVTRVETTMSVFYAHAFAADYVFPLANAGADPEDARRVAACQYAADWAAGVLERLAAQDLVPVK